jgi:hypothetical protein
MRDIMQPGLTVRDLARMKSYAGAVVVVLVLYWFFFIPGAIANYLYLQEARHMEEIAGEPLPGVGALRGMWLVTWGAAAFLTVIFVLSCVITSVFQPLPR